MAGLIKTRKSLNRKTWTHCRVLIFWDLAEMVSTCTATSDQNGRKALRARDQVMQPESALSHQPLLPLHVAVGVACPEALLGGRENLGITHAQLRPLRPFGPLPRPRPSHLPAPNCRAGLGRESSSCGWGFSDFLVMSLGLAVSGLLAPLSLPG